MNEKAFRKAQQKAKNRIAKRMTILRRKHWRYEDLTRRVWQRNITYQNGGGDGFGIA